MQTSIYVIRTFRTKSISSHVNSLSHSLIVFMIILTCLTLLFARFVSSYFVLSVNYTSFHLSFNIPFLIIS